MIQVEPSRCYVAPRISLADIRINLSGFRKFLTSLTIMRRFSGIYGILRMQTFCTRKRSEFALRQHSPFESSRSESPGKGTIEAQMIFLQIVPSDCPKTRFMPDLHKKWIQQLSGAICRHAASIQTVFVM